MATRQREVVGIADLTMEVVRVLGRAHAPVDRDRLEDREIDHRAARQVAQLELAVDTLTRLVVANLVERDEEGTGVEAGAHRRGQEFEPELRVLLRLRRRQLLGDVADDLDERHTLPSDAPAHVVALADELDLGQLLRLAVLLPAGGERGLEVDRDEERVLAQFPVPHRVHAEPTDALAVHEVTVDDVDVADADVHVRLGRRLERLGEHLGHHLGIGEVRDLEIRDRRAHLPSRTRRRRRVLDPPCLAHRSTPEIVSSGKVFRTVLGFSAPRQGKGRGSTGPPPCCKLCGHG